MRLLKIKSLPSVSEKWVDRDFIMVHACFQLLVDFVEIENGLNHCNHEEHKESVDALKGLYEWWLVNHDNYDTMNKEHEANFLLLIKHRAFLWT